MTDENKNEVFDKWKARLVDVYNLSSATPSFPAIGLILSLSTDPTMIDESYDVV